MKTSELLSRINQQRKVEAVIEPTETEINTTVPATPTEVNYLQPEETIFMITKVTAKPNPFFTSITLDVVCEQSRHTIVRMFDMNDRIVKMFSWYLVRGTNVTTITELNSLGGGTYSVDIIDSEAKVLYATKLRKEII
ncbi:MAG TPA: hypothetical protein VK616_12040 [Flavitalea sp.]|nr:hypothetical protein [Flavitalea sp.]HTF28819.1 hypothetical protein [Flavitalea sp.]